MENINIVEHNMTSEDAKRLQEKFGKNELMIEKKPPFFKKIFHIICEPMFLLLIIAATIYFILGEPQDGLIMLIFVIVIISIDIIQEWKTDKTLQSLKDLSAPQITVIRDNMEVIIASRDIVPGDLMIISEGIKIPADGKIVKCNDLCIDESSLTGESEGVWKISIDNDLTTDDYWKQDYVYSGTLVTQGRGYIIVDKIGIETEYGKISVNIAKAPNENTPLQKQINKIVKVCAIIASILFFSVSIITYLNLSSYSFKERIIESILAGITLAMSMIPEEFPVVLTVFLSMGAWRLAKKQSLVKKLPSVETLGSISVLCVDKTGTITMNQMKANNIWSFDNDIKKLVEIMGMACEIDAYDPMEKAMLEYCGEEDFDRNKLFNGILISEYSFQNEYKMMGHVWQKDNQITLAAKGAPESIIKICNLSAPEEIEINNQINEMSNKGMRVIAIGRQEIGNEDKIPKEIIDCNLTFCGLIGLSDPPRENVATNIEICNKAGIRVVMITGDNGITATSIAKQVGIKNYENVITGEQLNKMSDEELKECIKNTNIFSRVIPEHKMRIVKAFKENGEIVAMTGDGVNDAPALKYADIGIAMGNRGSEVSREAADLILLDDNFSTIVDTIKDGRRIYDNIRRTIGYIFTIHIPIALSALLAPLLNIGSGGLLFLPLHIVLLELIIDPTCSIVLERQPAESNVMNRKPRPSNESILDKRTLFKSILQGLVIFISSFGVYYITLVQNSESFELARTLGIGVIILSNLFLVHTNSSEINSVFHSLKQLLKDKVMCVIGIITILILLITIYTPINKFMKFTPLSINQWILIILLSGIAVFWYEIVKIFKRIKEK